MQLHYGGYVFADAEVGFSIHKQRVYSPRGRKMILRTIWDVTGWKNDDGSGLTPLLDVLENYMSIDGGDLVLYDNSGQPTVHQLLSANTLNGIQVMAPVEYPGGNQGVWGMSTEYVNRRTYRIRFVAEELDATDNLVSYSATLTRIGTGGNRNVWAESFTGQPLPQTTRQYTKVITIQQGRAVGLTSYPQADNPLFLDPFIQNEKIMLEQGSPQRICVNASLMWPLRWRYVYESGIAL